MGLEGFEPPPVGLQPSVLPLTPQPQNGRVA
jgi:hypothetical protein